MIDTPANRKAMPDADHSKWVQPEAIAKVVRFLVSSDSSPTSGAAVPVYVARRAVVREREPPDVLGRAGVLQRAQRRADQRDPARRRSGAPAASGGT